MFRCVNYEQSIKFLRKYDVDKKSACLKIGDFICRKCYDSISSLNFSIFNIFNIFNNSSVIENIDKPDEIDINSKIKSKIN